MLSHSTICESTRTAVHTIETTTAELGTTITIPTVPLGSTATTNVSTTDPTLPIKPTNSTVAQNPPIGLEKKKKKSKLVIKTVIIIIATSSDTLYQCT